MYTVKREMGHANASTTLDVYADEFDKARNADPAKRPNYGELLTAVGNPVETATRTRAKLRRLETVSGSQAAVR